MTKDSCKFNLIQDQHMDSTFVMSELCVVKHTCARNESAPPAYIDTKTDYLTEAISQETETKI